ncbi:hypothetical protein O181_017273 [Austropuccinia psidii MF-1]|uniref:Uncharacterized protein n=1 Tax=Austropuccinia psidii MF-1 TaxID=1389203 RepID=A0A9Q3C5U3_9BASI|nr:hypothetical protein [Austropuccinia psidii MF-1]
MDKYANDFTEGRENIYAIEKLPEEEVQALDFESEFMGESIRENSDDEKDPIEEFLVEYQEESHLEEVLPQETSSKDLFKNKNMHKNA